MSLRVNIFGGLVLFGALVSANGQSVALLQHVLDSDIIGSLRQKGIIVRPGQVTMLSTIPVRTEHPVLEAIKLEPFSAETSRVLMRCADRISCVPFYVVVTGLSLNERLQETWAREQKISDQKSKRGPVMMKRGSTAILEIAAPDMLITIPVVCLQNGRQGERIKVSSNDRRKIYLGEIVTSGLLRSRL